METSMMGENHGSAASCTPLSPQVALYPLGHTGQGSAPASDRFVCSPSAWAVRACPGPGPSRLPSASSPLGPLLRVHFSGNTSPPAPGAAGPACLSVSPAGRRSPPLPRSLAARRAPEFLPPGLGFLPERAAGRGGAGLGGGRGPAVGSPLLPAVLSGRGAPLSLSPAVPSRLGAAGWGPGRPGGWAPRPPAAGGRRRPRGRHEAAASPAAPAPGGRRGPARRQQDPQPVPGAPWPPRRARPPRRPGPARPRRQGWQGRRARGARREGRGRAAGTAGAPRGARAARRGGRGGRCGAGGGVRGAPALRLQRQARREPGAAAAGRAAALRAGAAERAGPLRRGLGQVHLPRARRLLLRGARHRLPRQPALRPGQERRGRGLLLPVLRGVAQARLAVGRRHAEAGARGPGVGAGRGGRLRGHLCQRQDGQHLLRVPGVLRLARLPCLRLMPLAARCCPHSPGGGACHGRL